jgi:hypothetical protein
LILYQQRCETGQVMLEFKSISNGPSGNQNNNSKIHVLFSKNGTPTTYNWNHYTINGNAGLYNTWVDYPYISITNKDLFISVNVIRDTSYSISPGMPTTYDNVFKPVMVLQIAKDSGYVGVQTPIKIWNNFKAKKSITSSFAYVQSIMPVSNGQGGHLTKGYMVATQQTYAVKDSLVYLFMIDSALYLNPKSYKYKTIQIPEKYSEPTVVKQGKTGVEVFDGNDNRIQSGFYLNNRVHVVFQTTRTILNTNKTQNGLQYVRINVLNNSVIDTTVYCKSDVTHFCYPVIASSGADSTSMQVTIPYLFAGDTIYPSIGAININYPVSGAKTISDTINIKNGISLVSTDIFDTCGVGGGMFLDRERWGDYIGVQRKYKLNGTTCKTRLWTWGMYGNNKDCVVKDTNAYGMKRGWFGWVQELGDTCLKTAIIEPYINNKVLVFPNPTQDALYIQPFVDNENYSYTLSTLQGQSVYYINNAHGLQTLPCNTLSSGVYILRIINLTSNTTSHEKIIINR